jgi:hypothetical protein
MTKQISLAGTVIAGPVLSTAAVPKLRFARIDVQRKALLQRLR